jgi:branched-chain amino acid aminotransferase
MEKMAWINGRLCPPEQAVVSVFDRGFLFGDGVYETGRSEGRVFLFMEEHLERLRSSASKLAISIPWTDDEISHGLYQAAKAYGKPTIYFRTIITRGLVDAIGLDVMPVGKPTLVHLLQPIDSAKLEKQREHGIRVLTSRIVRNSAAAQDPNIKTSNYLNSLLALQDVKARGGDDAIMVSAAGLVTEGTTFSVFAVKKDGTVITPSLRVGILDSITRRHVLEVARGFTKTQEVEIPLKEFLDCEEAFIASSVRACVPITHWDDKAFSPIPGPTTRKLQVGLEKVFQEYVIGKREY